MATKPANFDSARELLDTNKAERVSYRSNVHWTHEELICQWPHITEQHEQHERCRECINLFTDVSNTNQRRWVQDPKIKNEVYSGRWRLVSAEYDRRQRGLPGLIRTLRKGWAQTLDWKEALLIGGDHLSGDTGINAEERFVPVAFPNFDPANVDEATVAMRASTAYATGFTVEGRAYEGAWEMVTLNPAKQDDGSFTLQVMMAQSRYTLKTYDDAGTDDEFTVWRLWGVPKRTAQTIIDSYGVGGSIVYGTTINADYSSKSGLVNLTVRYKTSVAAVTITGYVTESGCLYYEETDYYFWLLKAAADAIDIETPPYGPAPQGWIYKANIFRMRDGFYGVQVVRRQAIEKEDAEQTQTITLLEVETVLRSLNQDTRVTEEEAQTPGRIRTTISRLNQFCLFDNDVKDRTATAISDAQKSKQIDTFKTDTEVADVHQNTVVDEEESQTAGKVTRTTSEKDELGRYTNKTKTSEATAVSDAQKSKQIDTFKTDTEVADVHQNTVVDEEESQTAGKVTRTTSEKDELGRYTNKTKTSEATAVSDVQKVKLIDLFQILTDIKDVHQESAVDEEADDGQTAGQVVETTSEKDELGRFVNKTSKKVASAVDDAEKVKTISKFEEVESVTDRNQVDEVAQEESQTPGEIVTTTSKKTAEKRFDNTVVTKTSAPVDDSFISAEDTARVTVAITQKRNQPAEEESINISGLVITKVRSILNDFIKYDTQKAVQTGKTIDSDWVEYTSRYGTAYKRVWVNQTLAWVVANVVGDFVAGIYNQLVLEATEYGEASGTSTIWSGRADRIPTKNSGAGTDTVIVSERSYDRVKLGTKTVGNKAYYRWETYTFTQQATRVYATAQGYENAYLGEASVINSGIRRFTNAAGVVYFEAWAYFFKSAEAWVAEEETGIPVPT